MKLQVITFTNTDLDDENLLIQSCRRFKLSLEVIKADEWTVNALKIKLLYQYLTQCDPESTYLIVDAFDVYINASEQEILKTYSSISGGVIFGAESNFYFRNSKQRQTYFRQYPPSTTIYKYLNSGTIMGSSGDLLRLLERILLEHKLDLEDESNFISVRSDQYLYSKAYVDESKNTETNLALDFEHHLFEVTGGRMRSIILPHISETHAYNAYKIERFLLKAFKLNQYQKQLLDLRYNPQNQVFHNTKTGTNPLIIHIPGSWNSFQKIMNELIHEDRKTSIPWIVKMIGAIAHIFSIIIPFRIKQ